MLAPRLPLTLPQLGADAQNKERVNVDEAQEATIIKDPHSHSHRRCHVAEALNVHLARSQTVFAKVAQKTVGMD